MFGVQAVVVLQSQSSKVVEGVDGTGQFSHLSRGQVEPEDLGAAVRLSHRRGAEGDRDPHVWGEEEVAFAGKGDKEETWTCLDCLRLTFFERRVVFCHSYPSLELIM